MNVFIILKIVKDFSGCYYEGDSPSISQTVVGMEKTADDVEKSIKALLNEDNRKSYDAYKREDIDYDYIEYDIPQHLIVWLWNNRDNK